jgi:hypothetical protein
VPRPLTGYRGQVRGQVCGGARPQRPAIRPSFAGCSDGENRRYVPDGKRSDPTRTCLTACRRRRRDLGGCLCGSQHGPQARAKAGKKRRCGSGQCPPAPGAMAGTGPATAARRCGGRS